jgi:glycosyltransferase involved in cell wall biosynthesis
VNDAGELILILGRDPLRTSGGNESYVVAHAKAAIVAGYRPRVFSMAKRSSVIETDYGFLHRVASPAHPIRGITAILHRPWLARAIARYLDGRPGPHVIHGFGVWADSAVAASRILARRGVEALPVATVFVATEHEAAAKLTSAVVRRNPAWWALHRLELAWVRRVTVPNERRAFLASRQVAVNYENVERLLDQAYGPGLRYRRLPYAPPTAFDVHLERPPLPETLRGFGDPRAPLIVSVSRHDGRKGLDVLIDALAGLRRDGVAFRACLVGPGLLLEAHRRRVTALGLADRVLVPGRVADVMPYLLHSDVYALPSREEGSGSVAVLEALQAGAAIVASDVDGIPEDLTDARDSLLVAPGDPVALQRALTRLLGDEALRARLGREARAVYERRFSPPVVASALARFYTELGLAPAAATSSRIAEKAPAT